MHRHTCATLIRAGVNVVGIVRCERRGLRSNAQFYAKRLRRYGVATTVGQILGRIAERALNGRFERERLRDLIDVDGDRAVIANAAIPGALTTSYGRADTMAWLAQRDPDILLVHSKFIVSKKVRALAKVAVIGGHPGITPWYRGGFSAFWAVRRGDLDRVGWTVFVLDDGVDTGPVIRQEKLDIEPGRDSHNTLGWRGMVEEAKAQAEAILHLDSGTPLTIHPVESVPRESYFSAPTLGDFVKYRRDQSTVR